MGSKSGGGGRAGRGRAGEATKPPRPTFSKTGGGRFYVSNALGTGGRSFEPGRAGKAAAQQYYRQQRDEWEGTRG